MSEPDLFAEANKREGNAIVKEALSKLNDVSPQLAAFLTGYIMALRARARLNIYGDDSETDPD